MKSVCHFPSISCQLQFIITKTGKTSFEVWDDIFPLVHGKLHLQLVPPSHPTSLLLGFPKRAPIVTGESVRQEFTRPRSGESEDSMSHDTPSLMEDV